MTTTLEQELRADLARAEQENDRLEDALTDARSEIAESKKLADDRQDRIDRLEDIVRNIRDECNRA